MQKLLLDTDIMIDYLRANKNATLFFESYKTAMLLISAISVTELYAGVHENHERIILNDFLKQFEIVEINFEIAQLGGLIKRDYGKKFGTGALDALIAACSIKSNARLVSLNEKHFKMCSNLFVPYKK